MKDEYLYYANANQVRGVEEYSLIEGRGANMRMMHVRNGLGLELTVAVDRCLDIYRLTFKGDNMSYYSACGNVSPTYYDSRKSEMVRSFTGGFLTTCGFDNVGEVCTDNGEDLPLHGRISNQPASHAYWVEEIDEFIINGIVKNCSLSLEKLQLHREIHVSKRKNNFYIKDTIRNIGEYETPCMVLYHMNMGYPLLSEHCELTIPSASVKGRDEFASKELDLWNNIGGPKSQRREVCYYHEFEKDGFAKIYNPVIKKGIEISYDAKSLPAFTQWNSFCKYDYVLGLEPGNCNPEGRVKVKAANKLKTLKEQEEVTYCINIKILEG